MCRLLASSLFAVMSFALLSGIVSWKSAATSKMALPAKPKVTTPTTTVTPTAKEKVTKHREPHIASAQATCGNVQLQLTPDYGFAIGSSSGGTGYTFALNGQPLAQGALTQRALFHYDNALASTSGLAPLRTVGTSLVPGKWGSALAIAAGGIASQAPPACWWCLTIAHKRLSFALAHQAARGESTGLPERSKLFGSHR